MYGMVKTTVYLPDELKAALKRTAKANGCSEAELIREGAHLMVNGGAAATFARDVDETLAGSASTPGFGEDIPPPRPEIPFFRTQDPVLLDPKRLDEAREGFGED